MQGEIADPDNKDWEINGEDPYHENKNRMAVVVEVVCKIGSLWQIKGQYMI
jgi:hypothetical protein